MGDMGNGASRGAGRLDTLARCGPDELIRERADRDVLLRSARTLVRALRLDPAGADALGAERRDLAFGLAAVEAGPAQRCDVTTAAHAFDLALSGAIDAVRRCRQTEHGVGTCWFSASPADDGCGAILRAAHRLG